MLRTNCLKTIYLAFLILFLCGVATASEYYENPIDGFYGTLEYCSYDSDLCPAGTTFPATLNCTEAGNKLTCVVTNNTNVPFDRDIKLLIFKDSTNPYISYPLPIRWSLLGGLEPGKSKTVTIRILEPDQQYYAAVGEIQGWLLCPSYPPSGIRNGTDTPNNSNIPDYIYNDPNFSPVLQGDAIQATIGKNIIFPAGAIGHNIDLSAVGESTQISLEPIADDPTQAYWVFGKTIDNPTMHWFEFTYDGETGARYINGRYVLYFIDGKRGDSSLIADGQISSVGGIAKVINTLSVIPVPQGSDPLNSRVFIINQTDIEQEYRVYWVGADGTSLQVENSSIQPHSLQHGLGFPDGTTRIDIVGFGIIGYGIFTNSQGKTAAIEAISDFGKEYAIPEIRREDGWTTDILVSNPSSTITTYNIKSAPDGYTINAGHLEGYESTVFHVEYGHPTYITGMNQLAVSLVFTGPNGETSMVNLSPCSTTTSIIPVTGDNIENVRYSGISFGDTGTIITYSSAGDMLGSVDINMEIINEDQKKIFRTATPKDGDWLTVEYNYGGQVELGNTLIQVQSTTGGIGAYTPGNLLKQGVLPLLLTGEGGTICRLVNPNNTPVNITIKGYDKDGNFLTDGTFTLPVHGYISANIPDSGNFSTITFVADQPITGDQIFKHKSGSISAIPLLGGY